MGGALHNPAASRAIGRASVVLLSSHFERYHYGLFEEITDALNAGKVPSECLPSELRLRHSRRPVDHLGSTQWDQRANGLSNFATNEATLWRKGDLVTCLQSTHLLEFMKSPKPDELVKLYRCLGIPDIFAAVTRRPHTRSALRMRIQSLVDKRNAIAHGDASEDVTQSDVDSYLRAALQFCRSVDRVAARSLRSKFHVNVAWYGRSAF